VNVAAVVLAAGGGRRYGMPKALVEHQGSLLVERAVGTAQAVCDPVLVVLGARAVDVWREARLERVILLVNRDWETGMASSLRTGLEGLRGLPVRVDAALVLLVDMPGMTPAALERLAGHAGPDALAVATYDGVRGHPVLLGRDHWAGVRSVAHGDAGARNYLRGRPVRLVECADIGSGVDVDTRAALVAVPPIVGP
jgi:CTP:molybdopterin cytidylyltransferase MocA